MDEANNIKIFEIPPAELGAGDVPHLVTYLVPLVSITFLIGKGFFDEIGKQLAQHLFKKLSKLSEISKVTILDKKSQRYIELIVPSGLSLEDCEIMAVELK